SARTGIGDAVGSSRSAKDGAARRSAGGKDSVIIANANTTRIGAKSSAGDLAVADCFPPTLSVIVKP
ncbi:MAG: hypothetical protein ABSH37_05965, partial [Bryobacteraceae bacterium]